MKQFDLYQASREKIILTAHRGCSAGNIPCNIIPAFEAALQAGADMIEIDVEMSADGKLFIFHPGMERAHLGIDSRICNMTAEEISRLRYVNYDRAPTQFGLNTLDELLETFKDRVYINVDKFWGHPREIYQAIKAHGMIEQVVVKSAPNEAVFDFLESEAPELPFMPIVSKTHPLHETLCKSKWNYIGAEVLFKSEVDEVATEAFIDRMHRDGKLIWVNAIIYNHREQLSAGHSDDTAICGDPERGWGWLARRGFDIIQTDWTASLSDYLAKQKLLYRR